METIFDKRISVYNGVNDTKGIVTSLRTFLNDTKHKDEIISLRTIEDKEARNKIKKTLPQATISGVFEPIRNAKNLKEHSGLICIDIDRQDNTHISNFDTLKKELSKLPEIAYLSKSVSGTGYFAIIPIKYPQYHRKHFEQLIIDFKKFGINIDKACGDVSRMRGISYDKAPYINENAITYEAIHIEPVRQLIEYRGSDSTLLNIEACISQIEATHTDITMNYNDWYTVCASLASLGEKGRTYFHACSRINPDYKYEHAERKYTQILRTVKTIGIASFFGICTKNGIYYK